MLLDSKFRTSYLLYLIGIIIGVTGLISLAVSHPLPAVALGLSTVYLLSVSRRIVSRQTSTAYHLLVAALLCNSAYSLIHLYRLLTYEASWTPWEEAIFLSVVRFPNILDIYSPVKFLQPPYTFSIYSPLYYWTLRMIFDVT